MKKLMFLYGEIVSGNLKEEVESLVKRFNFSPETVSNDLIKKHIQSFSETQPEGDSFYSRFFSNCLGYEITIEKPLCEILDINSVKRIRLSFRVDKIEKEDGDVISLSDLDAVKKEFQKKFKIILGLDYLEGRFH